MGTWVIHPFDDDTATDVADALDDAVMMESKALISRFHDVTSGG
ncbi:DUF4259 domain-containing protein [Streptomyces tendae]